MLRRSSVVRLGNVKFSVAAEDVGILMHMQLKSWRRGVIRRAMLLAFAQSASRGVCCSARRWLCEVSEDLKSELSCQISVCVDSHLLRGCGGVADPSKI
mmetsp:Transcript_20052/g.31373  ORF Transcript_20052/g.31373 Transcript_20052/m.31373 type:complete len:99 (+) Transcript_20052:405-701(+)